MPMNRQHLTDDGATRHQSPAQPSMAVRAAFHLGPVAACEPPTDSRRLIITLDVLGAPVPGERSKLGEGMCRNCRRVTGAAGLLTWFASSLASSSRMLRGLDVAFTPGSLASA